MYIYHGSNTTVEHQLIPQNHFLDFGFGFYTTFNKAQACDFARKVALRRRFGVATLNVYSVDEEQMKASCLLLRFDEPDSEWLEFVCANRTNSYTGQKYDLIYGPVANDDVYATVAAYLNGTFPKEITLAALKVKKLFNQLVFASELALSFLKFEGAERL